MSLTNEQQEIVNKVSEPNLKNTSQLYKVSAVAGAGKTHTLIATAQAVQAKKGLYLAFNKSVADEAKLKFPKYIQCKTIHSLAYEYVIKGTKQSIEELNIDSIKTKHRPEQKRQIINAMNDFFKSSDLSLSFFNSRLDAPLAKIAKDLITRMIDQTMPATFGFLIKYFYLQLHAGNITVEYDLVMLDEAGDLSEVTIEIFKLIKSPKKVMVGDPHQNIYTFINTVNGFEVLKDKGTYLTLSQSFRVEESIARRIERFCHKHLDANMDFKGIKIEDKTAKNRVYLARTNAGLITRMISLHDSKLQYNLLRDPKDIFALPLALITISTGKPIYRSEFKYLERDYQKFHSDDALKQHYRKFHSYLRDIHGDDENLVSALRLLETHKYHKIFETYTLAKAQPKSTQAIILATAHTSKGGTYDSVYIENDLNNVVGRIIEQGGPETEEERTELNLYYVATTRARVELLNANHL